MSHVRIFDGPKGKWFRAGQLPALALVGAFPPYTSSAAYEGRVQIQNAIGDCAVLLLSSSNLPTGYELRVDNDTSEVVLTWPAYSVTPEASTAIPNGNFEEGNTGWDLGASWEIGTWNWEYDGPDNDLQAYDGTKSAELHAGFKGNSRIMMHTPAACAPGTTITGSCQVQQGPSTANFTGGWVVLQFLDFNGAVLATHEGNHVLSGADAAWHLSSVTATAPTGTVYARLGGEGFRKLQNKPMWLDTFTWDLQAGPGQSVGTNGAGDISLCIRVTDSAGRTVDNCYVIPSEVGSFYEPFDDGLAPYTVDVGAIDPFSIVAGYSGDGLLMEPGPNATDAIRRNFTLQPLASIRFMFKVTNITADDYGVMRLRGLAGTDLFSFDCGRQAIADGLRRPMFRLTGQAGTPENRLGPGTVTLGRWYEVIGEYDLDALTFTLTITDTTNGSVFASATVSVTDNIEVSRVVWVTDNGGGTVIWDELLLNFEDTP